jgi:hypothetical protein
MTATPCHDLVPAQDGCFARCAPAQYAGAMHGQVENVERVENVENEENEENEENVEGVERVGNVVRGARAQRWAAR